MADKDVKQTEVWSCEACAEGYPCTVSITFADVKPARKENARSRFILRCCPCEEPTLTDWKRVLQPTVCEQEKP